MKLTFLLCLISTLNINCAHSDPQLYFYANQFVEDAARHGKTINLGPMDSITWGDLPGRVRGLCKPYIHKLFGTRRYEIVVSRQIKNKVKLKAIVYHELGHCSMKLKHTNKGSLYLMAPSLHSHEFYEKYWDELVNDLFTRGI